MAEQNDADQGGKDAVTEHTDEKSSLIDRRSYMKLTGGAAAGLTALASGSASAATERHGITFDRVVDAVDDLGLDPSGNESATGAIQNLGSGTLVTFPEGEYKLHTTTFLSNNRVGLVGEGDVKFVPSQGFNSVLLHADGVDEILIENIDIDIRADNTTAGIKLLCQNHFHVQDLEYLGRGSHPNWSNGAVANAFLLGILNSSGRGTLRNVVAKKGSIVGHYSEGRVGVWVGWAHQGTVRVENCDFREFGNNGMYAGRNRGDVQVIDSFFQNNNVCGIRISGEGSYAENCVVEVDMEKYDGPRDSLDRSFNPRGIIIEQARNVRENNEKTPGAEIRNCEIFIRNAPKRTQGGIHVGGTGRTLTATDTRVQIDQDGVPGVVRKQPGSGANPASSSPYWVHLENVSITGSASGGTAVRLDSADGSTVKNCCIQQTGSNRKGITLNGTNNATIEDTTVNVSGKAIDLNSSDADTNNVSGDGSCPVPDLSGNEADSGNTSDGTTEESTSDSSTSDGLNNSITIVGDQGKANYEFTVSEELAAGDYANLENADNPDVVEGSTATGRVWGGRDDYEFNGEITDFAIDNAATVRVNGEEVDPESLGTSNDVSFANTITIVGDQGKANYEFTVSEELAAGEYANLTNADNPDVVEGSTATGRVWGGRDDYEFNGEITDFAIDNAATVRVNGEEVDPTTLGTESSGSDLQNVLTIVGTETPSSYSFQVTGDIEKSTANGASINDNDVIEGSVAQGQVTGGKDSYAFSGKVSQFYLDGDATVTFDNGGA